MANVVRRYNIKKRGYRKRRGVKKQKQMFRRHRNIARQKIGFPSSSVVKLRYVDNVKLNLQNLAQYTYVFRANGLYDPNYTGTGGQPYGFDQISTYYNRYNVLGSKITLTATKADQDASDNAGQPIMGMGVYKANSFEPGVVLTIPDLQERGLCKVKVLTPNTSSGKGISRTTCTYSSKKWWQQVNPMDNTFQSGAPIDADPIRSVYYILDVGTLNGQPCPNISQIYNYNVQIDYIVKFSEPRIMADS